MTATEDVNKYSYIARLLIGLYFPYQEYSYVLGRDSV